MASFSKVVKRMVGMHAGHMSKTWNYDSKSSLLVPPTVADLTGDGKLEIIVCTSKGDLIVLDAQAQELWRYSVQEKSDAVGLFVPMQTGCFGGDELCQ